MTWIKFCRNAGSLRKQSTFGDATTGFPAKWRLRNDYRNSILMTSHYNDLGGASDWSCLVENLLQPIRSTTRIWVVMHHQYVMFALVFHTSFRGETRGGGVAKCRLFSQVGTRAKVLIFRLRSSEVFNSTFLCESVSPYLILLLQFTYFHAGEKGSSSRAKLSSNSLSSFLISRSLPTFLFCIEGKKNKYKNKGFQSVQVRITLNKHQ